MVIGVLPGHTGRIGHHDHTHFIGQTPKGTVWQYTAIDVASAYTWA